MLFNVGMARRPGEGKSEFKPVKDLESDALCQSITTHVDIWVVPQDQNRLRVKLILKNKFNNVH